MKNMVTNINSQEDSKEKEQIEIKELKMSKAMEEALKELEYMENHLDEYPHYDNREDLWESLLSDD